MSSAVSPGPSATLDPYIPGSGNAGYAVLAYDLDEFAGTLRAIAEGDIDVDPLITGEVGLDGVPGAFDALGNPEQHCKILVTPT